MPNSVENLVAAAVAPRRSGDLPARFALFPSSPEAAAPALAALQRDLAALGAQVEQRNAAGEALLVLPEHRLADAPAAFAAADAIVDGYGFAVVEPEIIHAVMPVQRLGPEGPADAESADLLPGCWVGEEGELKSRKRWALEAITIPAAWALAKAGNRPAQGQGIIIAQPDTGVTGHAELIGIRIVKPLNLLGDGKTPTDPTDPLLPEGNPAHGTATASVAVSPESLDVSGTAPAASLMPIRAIQSVVRLSQVTTAQAIDHAVANGAHVITMSLGGIASFSLWRALGRAVAADVIVLAAAGNCVSEVVWPARYEDCIAVAGIDAHDRAWPGTCRGSAVDISAPAQNVYRAAAQTGDAGQGQGTSFAVALTAGVAACWLAYHGRATAVGEARKRGETVQAMFRRLLRMTARVPAGWDSHGMGAGIIDAEALLKASFDDGLGEGAEETAVAAAVPSRGASVRDLAASVLGPAASALPVDWSRRDAEVSLALLTATQPGTESEASDASAAAAERLQRRVGGRDILMPHAMSISK
ncbi:S8 family peptidase [Bosea caraganae]|nr:S8 family serine peptidase [Bosea caraganae]